MSFKQPLNHRKCDGSSNIGKLRMCNSDSNLASKFGRSSLDCISTLTDNDSNLKVKNKKMIQSSLSRSAVRSKKKSEKSAISSKKTSSRSFKRSWFSHPFSLFHCCLTSIGSLSNVFDDKGVIETVNDDVASLTNGQQSLPMENGISSVSELTREMNTLSNRTNEQFESSSLMPTIDYTSSSAAASVSSTLSPNFASSSANSNSLQISSIMSTSPESAQNFFSRDSFSANDHNIDAGNLDLLLRIFRQSRHYSYLSTFPSGSSVLSLPANDDQENKVPVRYLLSGVQENETDKLRMIRESKLKNYIHTQIDYVNYLVPGLLAITNCSFYWGKIDRYEAERLLEGKPEGTFLLRDSAQEDHLFSVSFRRFERSLHARIEQWRHQFSFDSHDPGVFFANSVIDLIEHYKIPSHCMFFEPMLTKPLNRNFVFSLQHLARVNICDRVTYDSINTLPIPNILKSYLKEYHYRTKVRTTHFDDTYRYIDNYCMHCHR